MSLKNPVLINHHLIMLLLVDIFFQKNINKTKNLKPGQGGEVHITDAIKQLIDDGENFMPIFLKANI